MICSAVTHIKNIPNYITLIRVLGTAGLLFTEPFSAPFFLLYIVCGLSDVLDGYIARKMNAASRFGQVLDSISDLLFVSVVLAIMISAVQFPTWAIYWIVIIATVRLISIMIGFVKYRRLAFLHTYANKAAGAALFFFLFLFDIFEVDITIILICSIGSISAIEELLINLTSKGLCRDIKSIFHQ